MKAKAIKAIKAPKASKAPKKVLIIETIRSTEKVEVSAFRKNEILTPIPVAKDSIICIVLKDYNGMTDELRAGDIIELPERRFKSLSFRGMVKRYDGNRLPNRLR